MKFISWNVNGLRACMKKGFTEFMTQADADVICVQETKMQPGQADVQLSGYHQYWNSAERKGYSGTAVFTRREPLSVAYDIENPLHTGEGRSITLEFPEFYLVTFYTPNSQPELARIDYRMQWEDAARAYLQKLDAQKPVILCGDLNVAHEEIDLKNPGPNRGSAGFSDQEREKFTQLLHAGFTDTFRTLHPQQTGAYSWWSYRFHARENNAGWRIDYFLVSDRLFPQVTRSEILSDIYGSDHCPILLELTENMGSR
ncbi:MAG: exodeoxyribonuclease III [Oscillospiraceae bacterium]|jgi:exodeoxyribonuclease-3|nr:exodeoxyribonuclease III [Oscillospiraceae bacterium]